MKTLNSKITSFESNANGFNTKNFFYDTGSEVVVFDTQFTPELAEESIRLIQSQTTSPIRTVVITHPNPDKFNGIAAFKKLGAKVIASKSTRDAMAGVHAYKKYFFVNMAKMFTEESYPALESIDEVFEGCLELKLPNRKSVKLVELEGPGVSSTQTVAIVPELKALIVGDMIHHKAHAWLEGGIVNGNPTPTIESWKRGLREIESLARELGDATIVYGGRGESAETCLAVREQIAYLDRAQQVVSAYIQKLGARASELRGPQAGEHSAALASDFGRELPGRELSYLIQYGVYGLVNALNL